MLLGLKRVKVKEVRKG